MPPLDWGKRPEQDVHIELPSMTVEINHRLKVVFMFISNPSVQDEDFKELESHLKRRGYFLQVFTPSIVPPAPAK